MTDEQLLELKTQLYKTMNDITKRQNTKPEMERTELSNYDNHPADQASDLTSQTTELALDTHQKAELDQVESALKRIGEGTYGYCKVCEKPIPFERLQTIPTTATCVDHVEEKMSKEYRPVEEEVLSASADHPRKDDDRIRDYENTLEEVTSYGSSDTPSDGVELME